MPYVLLLIAKKCFWSGY